MNLKLRLNLIITSLLALVLFVGAYLTIDNAREDVRAEVESTATLALHLLDAEIMHYSSEFGWLRGERQKDSSIFRLHSLDDIRHLKIEFFDAHGQLRDSNQSALSATQEKPPNWFMNYMGVTKDSMQPIKRTIFMNGRVIGELVVTPDPSYEIAEIWNDILGLLILVALFFIVVNLMVYYAVNGALKPVSDILTALTKLEHGELGARLPYFSLPELKEISTKFNKMTDTLQKSIQDNHRLTQQLIKVQEDERKSLARDLHDEIGQHLTAIHLDASAILNAKTLINAKDSAVAIDTVARQMMGIVHSMLQRLRPSGLDQFGLNVALDDLIETWRRHNRGINTSTRINGRFDRLDETVAIAAYRIVQECLTNIAKHANARFVSLSVSEHDHRLHIYIQDDGDGFVQEEGTNGFGLAGMRERVEGLGGNMQLSSESGVGTIIQVILPSSPLVQAAPEKQHAKSKEVSYA